MVGGIHGGVTIVGLMLKRPRHFVLLGHNRGWSAEVLRVICIGANGIFSCPKRRPLAELATRWVSQG